ncbi:hypothetical protein EW093_14605 [Thiospirochaeta perfilievii]|uniref:Uncharacterized protein n=1 Tax=Thiospirochaeta perfilievii TaxID=252967 RepID=A0A5C1QFN7_9SPIO|nr:DUF5312 family protein [Thiospirochaeta perfilievii]QEN05879.1 hypothetical protein EW093_14605 [Thiospirochaeta perfilievii]
MNNKNFNDLAHNLSDSEKKSLLNQINDNLTANPIQVDEKYASFIEKENKDFKTKSLKKDVQELGFFQKLFLNIRSFILGKDILEVYNHDLLQNIERRIVYSAPTLVSVKQKRFTSLIINDFLKINSLSLPFVECFAELWDSPIALERLIGAIIGERYNSIKSNLYDFLRESEIDKSIAAGENLETIKKNLLRSMYDYRKKIPDFIFPESEDELLSLISLKNIVMYNYSPMFKLMGINQGDDFSSVSSKTVSMNLVVKYLEEFYKLLIHFTGSNLQRTSITAIYEMTKINDDGDDSELWDSYTKLSEKLKNMTVVYPFDDIIKYSRNNPFYKIDFSIPKIDMEEFYFSALKKEMMSELTTVFDVREKAVIKVLFDSFFSNYDLLQLNNYNVLKDFDPIKLSLPYFKYIETINILLNFLKHYYIREYKDILFVLSKHILEKNHVLQSRSLEVSIGVETLLERILKFDRSLAHDSESGKTMRTLFNTVATNRQNLRMYKAFIKQKDEEALELCSLGAKLLLELDKLINQTVKNPSDTIKLQVSAIHPSISRKSTLKDILLDKSKELKKFLDIYNKKIIFDSEKR